MNADIQAQAAKQRAQFEGMNLSIGKSKVVHRVALFPWMLGVRVPAPDCKRGFALDSARLVPRDAPVTCKACGHRSEAKEQPPSTDGARQMSLLEAL
ncbi:hypothetical protein ACWFMI_23775 [Nocardiopsis terrae]|uniref:hypothetical protein n=1 Tax=Streptomyces sp. NPDC057554 TaxID=3350538 RepID=UPI0036A6EE36